MLSFSNSAKLMIMQMLLLCTKTLKFFRHVDYSRCYKFFFEKLLFCKKCSGTKNKSKTCQLHIVYDEQTGTYFHFVLLSSSWELCGLVSSGSQQGSVVVLL
jgi:hypothetical protein